MSLIWFDPFVWPFHAFVAAHIVSGAIGAVAFWIPVVARKGGTAHRYAGRVFASCMLLTGLIAICMSVSTLLAPLVTHPHVHESAQLIRGIFGWMMLYLAILTINLTWYGWLCILRRRSRAAMRGPVNLLLQALLLVAAGNCFWRGIEIGQVLMVGISFVGFATVATNLWYLYKPAPGPIDWQLEHIKALVGAGISVYTAFFAFGAVRLMPELALNPAFWSIPLVTGLILIVYHQQRLIRRLRRRTPSPMPVSAADAPPPPGGGVVTPPLVR